MTTAATARCTRCEADRPAGEMYSPYGGVLCCRDTEACRRRQDTASDPTMFLDSERREAGALAPSAPAGTVCAACGQPGDLYNRGTGYFHRDRAVCDRVMAEDFTPRTPDDWDPSLQITSAQMRAAVAAGRPEVGPDPVPATDAEIRAAAAIEALGRKR